jgi:hypothetical protein
VLAAEHLLRFARFDTAGQIVQGAAEIVGDGLPCLGPLDQHGEIVHPPLQRVAEIQILLEPPATLQQLLGAGLVLPEIRLGDFLFYFGEFFGGTRGVKDGSAGRLRAARDPRTCEADPLSVGTQAAFLKSEKYEIRSKQ